LIIFAPFSKVKFFKFEKLPTLAAFRSCLALGFEFFHSLVSVMRRMAKGQHAAQYG
jgi:hypothetical protein